MSSAGLHPVFDGDRDGHGKVRGSGKAVADCSAAAGGRAAKRKVEPPERTTLRSRYDGKAASNLLKLRCREPMDCEWISAHAVCERGLVSQQSVTKSGRTLQPWVQDAEDQSRQTSVTVASQNRLQSVQKCGEYGNRGTPPRGVPCGEKACKTGGGFERQPRFQIPTYETKGLTLLCHGISVSVPTHRRVDLPHICSFGERGVNQTQNRIANMHRKLRPSMRYQITFRDALTMPD